VVRALTILAALLFAAPIAAETPHLEKRGSATQLIVDGEPFLSLGGELGNSSASSREYMRAVWPKLAAMHLNTVLAPVSWDVVEPQEGKFDFSSVDGLIEDARAHDVHLVLLWFGTWKNSTSSYAPGWVKRDARRFARTKGADGRAQEIISAASAAARAADAKAFAALMRHLRERMGTSTRC
jgi:beta-galactosidase GanA